MPAGMVFKSRQGMEGIFSLEDPFQRMPAGTVLKLPAGHGRHLFLGGSV